MTTEKEIFKKYKKRLEEQGMILWDTPAQQMINNRMQEAIHEAYEAGMERVSNITEKHNEYIKAQTAQAIFTDIAELKKTSYAKGNPVFMEDIEALKQKYLKPKK